MQAQATAASFEDDYFEQAVLRHILDWQPTILRLEDLIREVSPDPREFAHRDGVQRAVRDLVKVGLLFREGECVLPTTATVYVRGWAL
jgi:hypothetical protein